MKSILAFVVSAGVLVAIGLWFINNNPVFLEEIVNWALNSMGII